MPKSCNCKSYSRSMFTSSANQALPYLTQRRILLSKNKIREVGWFYQSKDFYHLLYMTITDHMSFLQRNSHPGLKRHFPKYPLHERYK